MDEDLQMLYGIREEFDEVTHHYRENSNSDLKNVYVYRLGISEGIPSGTEGTIDVEGLNDSVEYTLDSVRGNPLLRMSHSFDEIEKALSRQNMF